ncbi:MAG TPA: hypothetical protein VI997_05550 [Candidatus Thermoplasmatota archaeon]|nr:hypothetical protein [Candidatus Thermoplasmatota archaeon]
MDEPTASVAGGGHEREHLVLAHHEIRTALTVLRSNIELVRIRLRAVPLPEHGVPVHAHLTEIDGAVDRLRDVADVIRRWHDDMVPDPTDARNRGASDQGTVPVGPRS